MIYGLDLIACAVVTMRAVYVLNKMDCRTRHAIATAYILMAIGGFASFFGILLGHLHPEWKRAFIDCALGILIMFNQRKKATPFEPTRQFEEHDHTLVLRK